MALENRLKEYRARLGEDLSGDSGRYFYLYGGWRR